MYKVVIIAIASVVMIVFVVDWIDFNKAPIGNTVQENVFTPTSTLVVTKDINVVEPVAGFRSRITKKFFGTYITPNESPVKPEKFTGYHTGLDVEFEDVTIDVPVYAIFDGTIVVSRYASGYGGVIVIKHEIGERILYGVYGHMRLSSLKNAGVQVMKGEQVGVLGTGYTKETDGERKHLHFSIATVNSIKGYAKNKTELNTSWINPLLLYPELTF